MLRMNWVLRMQAICTTRDNMTIISVSAGYGAQKKKVSIELPDCNFAQNFVLDEENSTDKRKWVCRLAFGTLDKHIQDNAVKDFTKSLKAFWFNDGVDYLTITEDNDMLLATWKDVCFVKTDKIINGAAHTFYEFECRYYDVQNAKD
jgi:hypothetical protein